MDNDINDIKRLIYTSLISADNDKYTEDAKQESMYRYKLEKDNDEIDFNDMININILISF